MSELVIKEYRMLSRELSVFAMDNSALRAQSKSEDAPAPGAGRGAKDLRY